MCALSSMKIPKWLLLVLLLIANQLVRSPVHLWNWTSEMSLWSMGYQSVVYESNNATVEVYERPGSLTNQEILVVFGDMHSPIGLWEPLLKEMNFDGTVRFVRWFGRGDSEWLGTSIVFSDLDSILNMVLSDVDESTPITFLGQGSGAQLMIRYSEQNPSRAIKMIAIHSEGFDAPRLVPQMVSEVKDFTADDVGDQWLPNFVYHDWLTWLHNPFSEAIQKETHLVPRFKHAEMTRQMQQKITWVGFAPSVVEGASAPVPKLTSCSFEAQWSCSSELSSLLTQVLSQ